MKLIDEARARYFELEVSNDNDVEMDEYQQEKHAFDSGWNALRSVIRDMGYLQLLTRIDTKQ